ncbi:MAG TPA: hypothetical protein VG755_14820 [Nannocystaceae bacterium]|nr:hypothetical protein [Nannocystaceae bacterium]
MREETREEPAAVAVAPMLSALPNAVPRPRPLYDPELDDFRRASVRGYVARTQWSEPRPGDPLFACQRDDDCAIVHLDVCDETNGGWILSVRKDRAREAEYRWGTTDDADACSLLYGLTEAYPRCGGGTCMRGYRPKAKARRMREDLHPAGGKPHPFQTMVPNHVPPR